MSKEGQARMQRSNSRANDIITPSEPLYFLRDYYAGVEPLLEYDPSVLPQLSGRPLEDCRDDLLAAFAGDVDWRQFVTAPPPIVKEFQMSIRGSVKTETFRQILSFWPPVIPDDPVMKSILIFLVRLIHDSDNSLNIIRWVCSNFAPEDWHKWGCKNNSQLKVACTVTLTPGKKANYDCWALLDGKGHFFVQKKGSDRLETVASGRASNVSVDHKGKIVKLMDRDGQLLVKFSPKEASQLKIWETILKKDHVPFPLTFTSAADGMLPEAVLPALFEALTADDMLLVRSLTHFSVAKVLEGVPLQFALVDIFAYAGKINQFLVTMVGNEFNNEGLQQNAVLRVNSHLTCLFKVWNDRFGRNFFAEVIKKMINYVDSHGDIGLNDHENCDEHAAKKMVFTCLKTILKSGDMVPPEMRHLASVLKSVVGCRFNSKQATFNTLSGHFFLRFVTALLAFPEGFDQGLKVNNAIEKVMMPFSQLLQIPCNLINYGSKYHRFKPWNKQIQAKIFPDLVDFTFSIADLDEVPKYEPPSPERLVKSLETVYHFMTLVPEKLSKRFNELMSNRAELVQPVGWNIGAFMMSLFKNNIAD